MIVKLDDVITTWDSQGPFDGSQEVTTRQRNGKSTDALGLDGGGVGPGGGPFPRKKKKSEQKGKGKIGYTTHPQ